MRIPPARLGAIRAAQAAFIAGATYNNIIATTTPATLSNVVSGSTTGTALVNADYQFNGNLVRASADKVHLILHQGADSGETGSAGNIYQRTYTISSSSWGSSAEIWSGGGIHNAGSMATHPVDGELWCFFARNDIGNIANNVSIRRIKSTDGGVTWGTDELIYAAPSAGYFQPTSLMRLKSDPNTFFLCVTGYLSGRRILLLKSTDGGVTFPTEIIVYAGASNYSESSFENIDDTNMICVHRDDGGNYLKMITSTDGGHTWGASVSTGIGSSLDQKVQPRIFRAAQRRDRLGLLFYDRGDDRFKWQSTTEESAALANNWGASFLLGTNARGYGDICDISGAPGNENCYLVTNDKEISGSQCNNHWWKVKDIYANSTYAAPYS